MGDRGGGTSSPSPSASPPMAISTRSTAWGDPGEDPGTTAHRLHPGYGFPPAPPRIRFPTSSTPDTAAHLISQALPLPRGGAGAERRRRGRGGAAGRERMLNRQEGAGKGCQREVTWLECGRQGRGNEFPLPVGPTPRGDIHTVHSMGRSWRRAGHGCSPDIATHGPRPPGATRS